MLGDLARGHGGVEGGGKEQTTLQFYKNKIRLVSRLKYVNEVGCMRQREVQRYKYYGPEGGDHNSIMCLPNIDLLPPDQHNHRM